MKLMNKMNPGFNKPIHVVFFNFIHQFYDSETKSAFLNTDNRDDS